MDEREHRGRRLVPVAEACRYGCFRVTKAYALLAEGKITAYKLGARTLVDLDTVDEFLASLPRFQSRSAFKTETFNRIGESEIPKRNQRGTGTVGTFVGTSKRSLTKR